MRRSIITVVLILLGTATAFAQPPDIPAGRAEQAGPGCAGNQNRERLRERIEMMTMWKLTQALDLDEATAQKLFPVLDQHNIRQRQLREKRAELLKQLNEELAKDSSDPAVLRKAVDEFKKTETEIVQARNQRLDELSKILSDKQIAQLIVFVPRFERQIKNLMNDVRLQRRLQERKPAKAGNPEPGMGNSRMRRQRGDIPEQNDTPPPQ